MSGVTTQKATTAPIPTTVPTTATIPKETVNPSETAGPNTPPSSPPGNCEPPGTAIKRDIEEGECIMLTCGGNCLKIINVLFDCPPMTAGFNEDQKNLVERHCDNDVDLCIIEATNEFFGTNLQCEGKPLKLWIEVRSDLHSSFSKRQSCFSVVVEIIRFQLKQTRVV